MATLTVDVPKQLAEKLQPFSRWLAPILELSLLHLETEAAKVASELIAFLASNPSEQEVKEVQLSERARQRLKRLMVLNDASALTPEEQQELDELEKLEHSIVMLKMRLTAST